MDNSVRNNERANFAQSRCSHYGVSYSPDKCFKKQQNGKGYKKPSFIPHNSNNKCNEHNGRKPNTCFIYGLEDHFITNFPELDNFDNKVHWNMKNLKLVRIDQQK